MCRERSRTHGRAIQTSGLLFAFTVLLVPAATRADIIHLTGGGSIEGQILKTEGGQHEIRTAVGTVRIAADTVERVEKSDTPFEEYDRRAATAETTPAGQTELAAWCDEHGLRTERRRHLLMAVDLDPNYEPARRMLGQVRAGDLWLDARRSASHATEGPEQKATDESERLARAIQNQWRQRLHAIKSSLLENQLARLVQEGRDRIRAITDPLAILPLVQVLSGGDSDCRELLVRVLAAFPQDEATLNLAVLAIVMPEGGLRQLALDELARRKDLRVIEQYRDLLRSGRDAIVSRAAVGIGQFGSMVDVPDLVDALTARRTRTVEVPVPRYFWAWTRVFSGLIACTELEGGTPWAVHWPEIGVAYHSLPVLNETASDWQRRRVTVYRTEVLEALRKITGQDFGFERDRWRQWYESVRR